MDKAKFIKFLGGREGEEERIWLLLALGFFMGIFLATLQVPAETLITTLGTKYIDRAFFAGGGLGVIATALYVYAQKRVRFTFLAIATTLVVFFSMIAVRLSFFVLPYEIASFILFVSMGPFLSITLLNFWGTFGRLFDIRSSKRIIGGIDVGQLTATCIAFFAISLISEYLSTLTILWISVGGSFFVALITIRIVNSYNLDKTRMESAALKARTSEGQKNKHLSSVSYLDLFRNKYFLTLSAFLLFSVCASKFNEHTYRTAMFTWYEGDQIQLNRAYSTIDGIIIVVSFLIQTFINDFIIGRYGLRISLMVMPFLLGLFTVGSIVSGHVFGYEAGNSFFIFFSFAMMGRILATSLRDALENPAFKMFFFPIEEKNRFDVQSRVEGVVNEFAGLLAGGVLTLLSAMTYFELIHFSYFLIALVAGTVFMASKLFAGYKGALHSSLKRQKQLLKGAGLRNERNITNLLNRGIKAKNPETVLLSLKFSEHMEPILLRKFLINALQSSSASVRLYAFKKCADLAVMEHLEDIKVLASKEREPAVKEVARQTAVYLQQMHEQIPSIKEISVMIRNTDAKQRLHAAQLFSRIKDMNYALLLVELMRDTNPTVRRAAIVSAGLLKMPDYWTGLINNLQVPEFENYSKAALIACGSPAFQTIDTLFYRTNQTFSVMFRVIQILGRIGTPEGMERVWKKIDFPNKKILRQCILSLSYYTYRTSDLRAARVKIQIEEEIGNITWNLGAITKILDKHPLDALIKEALHEENARAQEDLFVVMAMVYDPQSVQLVKENVEFGTPDSLAYAIELMNIFLDEEIKPRLFPLFDDLRADERIEKLRNYYAPEQFKDYEDLLLQIINRDYKSIDKWTKGLCVYRLISLPNSKIGPDIIANIFNPDHMLLQSTAFFLYKKNRNEYRRHTLRLSSRTAKSLDLNFIPPEHVRDRNNWQRPLLLIERAMFLKKVQEFSNIPGDLLAEIADLMEEKQFAASTLLIKKGTRGHAPVYIVVRGKVSKHTAGKSVGHVSVYGLFGLKALVDSELYAHSYTTLEPTTCLVLSKEKFFTFMSRHPRLVEIMLRDVGATEQQKNRIVLQE